MSTPAELLRCTDLVVGYGRQPLLPPISLSIGPGEFWAVVGRNGSGKSTWFRTALGLLPAISGTVTHCGSLAYVAQQRAFDPLYPVTVREVVAMGTMRGWGFLRRGSDTSEAMEAVGVTALAEQPFRALSEGQKQRVLLARMITSGARLALLDEPTAAMDAVAEREAMALLVRLQKRYAMSVVVVSHHLPVALGYADRVLFLDRDGGTVVCGTPAEVAADDRFRTRYGDTLEST
ncbi:MAG: zinc transport system ATP-binding protein [Myxococcota bacterium]|jgi:zinc transport system ATP-binding protein